MQDRCQADIVIIQGDTYQKNLILEGVYLDAIENIYFSCGKLNITKEMPYDQTINRHVLKFTSEETQNFKPIVTDYDITVKFFDSSIRTGVYRGKMIVCEKNNPVEEY